jgi:hypothetical protein
MRDQGRIIPLQQIRPAECLPAIYLRSIRNRGIIPDGPKPTPRVGLCAITGCSQTQFQLEGGGAHIATDVELLSTILLHNRDHGS